MENIPNPNATGSLKNYIQDSTGMGHHDTSAPTTTGSNVNYAVNNIYDLAGNVFEWTMESYYTDCRISRGGIYGYTGADDPASCRYYDNPSFSFDGFGFRLALYL